MDLSQRPEKCNHDQAGSLAQGHHPKTPTHPLQILVSLQYWKVKNRFFRMPHRAGSYALLKNDHIEAIHHITGRYGIITQTKEQASLDQLTKWELRQQSRTTTDFMLEYLEIPKILTQCNQGPFLMIAAESFEEHEDFVSDCIGRSPKWAEIGKMILEDAEWISNSLPLTSAKDCQVLDSTDNFTLTNLESIPERGILLDEDKIIKYARNKPRAASPNPLESQNFS
jgi:hypothetical protein